jgi:hypothetical protein
VSCCGYFCEKHRWRRVPAEGEDILADPYDWPKVKSVYVCNECYNNYRSAVKTEQAALKEERRLSRVLASKRRKP